LATSSTVNGPSPSQHAKSKTGCPNTSLISHAS
jgi:hypothetical protein